MNPPRAERKEEALTAHGHTRIDPWFWMNDREDPAVLDYLRQENEWCDRAMESTRTLQEAIYKEIRARIPQDDQTVVPSDCDIREC